MGGWDDLCPAAMRARFPVPGILRNNQMNVKRNIEAHWVQSIEHFLERALQKKLRSCVFQQYLMAESGCERMESKEDIKVTSLLLVENCDDDVCFISGISYGDGFYRTQVSLGSGLWVSVSLCLSQTFGWNFADVTLADDDTNSILTDYANRAIWS